MTDVMHTAQTLMTDYEKALELARTWVRLMSIGICECAIVEKATIARPYGWFFNYYPTEPGAAVGGAGPLLVDRINFEVRVFGSAYGVWESIANFEATVPREWLDLTDADFEERRMEAEREVARKVATRG